MIFNFFKKKVPTYNDLREIASAGFEAIVNNKNDKYILSILNQAKNLIAHAKYEDIKSMNMIASLLARPRFRKMELAVRIWERVLELDPLNFNALRFLFIYYLDQNKIKNVYQKGSLLLKVDYKKEINIDTQINNHLKSESAEIGLDNPKNSISNLYVQLGDFYAEHQEYSLSINAFKIALEIDPKNMDAQNNISVAYFHKKEFLSALENYKKTLHITPLDFQREYTEVIKKYNVDPNSNKGAILKEKTQQMIDEAEAEILFNIGECYFKLDRISEARMAIKESIIKNGNSFGIDIEEKVEGILSEFEIKLK